MEIPLKYELTKIMVDLISKIEAKRAIIENTPVSESLTKTLRRQSLLKSSLFSAKIEGNKLNLADLKRVDKFNPDYEQRIEVENILAALSFVNSAPHKNISLDYILNLHAIVMKRLRSDLGRIRNEPSAIFNESGFPVYIPPPPSELGGLLDRLVAYLSVKTNENVFIKASLAHLSFEKIHPFIDGNGRVGRLLFHAVTIKEDYPFKGLLSIEELLNERKAEYYEYLDRSDATSFIEFMLEIINEQLEKVLDEINNKQETSEDLLLPRRKEILDLIRDHRVMTLDAVRRRFLRVSPRMIRYDLKKLEEQGFIIKLGATRGAMYKLK
ncbi:MAG TPA: Fic family protein [Patescibacteria group bacterium]|jgi:Fic family protein|nr:Fic family protein [Patescibacteria group bacterium]